VRDGLKNDRAHLVIGKISKFGILELSRERLSPPLLEKSHVKCTACEGAGLIRSVESSAFMALREIQLYLSRNKVPKIRVGIPEDVGMYLLNQQKRHLMRLEQEFNVEILVGTDNVLVRGQAAIEPAQ
jgi:ribonuclease E